jgi:hypothetical protein
MRLQLYFATAVASLAMITACSTSATSSRQTRTTVPPGPVQTSTSAVNMIPAGTEFTVRTNEQINSSEAGRNFSAELAQEIVNSSGRVLAPRNSPVTLTVYEVDSGGVVGTPTLQLGVSSITINGVPYRPMTNTAEQKGREGLGGNRRTAEHVGGGAILGTVIGAIAGGGKGAAIGAAVGAAGGAAAQVITRGKEVKIPAESILTFRFSERVDLSAD